MSLATPQHAASSPHRPPRMRWFLVGAAVALAVASGSATAQSTLRDPGGRFALSVPKGWQVADSSEQASVIVSGNASVTVMVAPGAAAEVLEGILGQVAGQWSQFQELKRGPATVGGRPATQVVASGTNPRGVPSYFKLTTAESDAGTWVMMASVPQSEFAKQKAALEALERGVALGRQGAPATASEPRPAPADRQKLAALDDALRAGVLTQEEYDAKRRELLRDGVARAADKPKPKPPEGGARRAEGASSGVYRMRLVRVMDKQGFGEPVEVFRLMVPSDWRVEDSVVWDASQMGCPANIVRVSMRATAPDGLTGIEVLPAYTWTWTDDPMMQQILRQQAANRTGCAPYPVMGAADFVQNMVVPAVRQGAQAAGAEPLPQVAQAEERALVQQYQQLIQAGYMRGIRVDIARVRLAFSVGQRAVEEWMNATVALSAMPTASTADLMQGNLNYSASNYNLTGYNVFAVRAPRGELDAKAGLFGTIVASIRPNPAYQAAIARFQANIGKINMDGARERHRIWQDANASIQRTWQETVRYRQEVQDRQAEQFGRVIRGVDLYTDPSTNERIELGAGYKNAWTNGKGEYLLSDSVNFDPSVEFREDWRALKRIDR